MEPAANAVASAAVPPMFSAAAVPVMLVPTNADGVPRAGATNVGEVDKTTLPVPVVDNDAPHAPPTDCGMPAPGIAAGRLSANSESTKAVVASCACSATITGNVWGIAENDAASGSCD